MFLPRSSRIRVAGLLVGLIALLFAVGCRSDRSLMPPPTAAAATAGPHGSSVPAANLDSVGIQYVCENRFRIRNRNAVGLAVQWAVVGTTDSGTVVLAARPPSAAFSETYLDVPDSGTVRLSVGSARIASAQNRGGACDGRRLTLFLEPGVIATPAGLDTTYAVGATVSYSFAPAPGHTHVLVSLDDNLVPASGRVVMSKHHLLWAAADVDVTLPPPGDPLVAELRGLLTAADPVAAYQQVLDDVWALTGAVGPDEASRRVKLAELVAYDPIRDSTALIRMDDALALHAFRLGSSEYDGSGASGGPILIASKQPAGAMRDAAPAAGCVPQRAAEVPGSPEPTRVVVVNGIRTTESETARALANIRCGLDKSGQTRGSRFTTDYFYNRTWSVQRSEDIRADFWCVAASIRWSGYWSLERQAAFYAACASRAAVIFVRTNDYVEAVTAYLQVQSNSPRVIEDSDSLARYLVGHRGVDGEHVVLVAHSQGNLLVQQAVRKLRDEGLIAPRNDSLCVGAVALAAPTSANWPIDKDLLSGVMVPGDVIDALPGPNRFAYVATPLSDSLAAAVARVRELATRATDPQDRRAMSTFADQMSMLNGFQLHSLAESYLGQQPALDAIVHDIVHIHRQCTLGRLALDPAAVTVRVQETVPLALSATNRNSSTMRLNRTVSWNVPFILALSNNQRRVTATSPGVSDITARVFDREGRASFTVPMETLVVAATQTRRTSWKLDESNAPADFPDPDLGAPPEWDGDPGHCVGYKTDVAADSARNATYTWVYYAHCWISATGTVQPPDVIRIARYRWRWFDPSGVERFSPINRLTTYTVQDMPADEPLIHFAGWGYLEVWGLNADGVSIAKGMFCLATCGGTP